jgi:hypothetical protein
MTVRNAFVFSLVVTLALVIGSRAGAQAEVGDSVTTTATVESVDLATRNVVLKNAEGKTTSVVVPENIQNLEKLQPGDSVTTTYSVALAAEILKPGEEPAPAAVSAAKQGGGEIVGASQVSAVLKVDKVDLATNSVTLTGPKGNTRTLQVKRPEVREKLKLLKPGDEVQVTYTEAVAMRVERKEK